ncbi:MAG: hypothetical protein JG760_1365, partial [Desulfomicrobiaceae bacterium]|nr:hypothetical protein [Desulfomicrobiaceae bacterium]
KQRLKPGRIAAVGIELHRQAETCHVFKQRLKLRSCGGLAATHHQAVQPHTPSAQIRQGRIAVQRGKEMRTPCKDSVVTGGATPRASGNKEHRRDPPRPVAQTHPLKAPHHVPGRRHAAYSFGDTVCRRQRRQVPEMRFRMVFWLPHLGGYRGSTAPDLHRTCLVLKESQKRETSSSKHSTRQGGNLNPQASPQCSFRRFARPPLEYRLTAAQKVPKFPQPARQRCGCIRPRPVGSWPRRPRPAWGDWPARGWG